MIDSTFSALRHGLEELISINRSIINILSSLKSETNYCNAIDGSNKRSAIDNNDVDDGHYRTTTCTTCTFSHRNDEDGYYCNSQCSTISTNGLVSSSLLRQCSDSNCPNKNASQRAIYSCTKTSSYLTKKKPNSNRMDCCQQTTAQDITYLKSDNSLIEFLRNENEILKQQLSAQEATYLNYAEKLVEKRNYLEMYEAKLEELFNELQISSRLLRESIANPNLSGTFNKSNQTEECSKCQELNEKSFQDEKLISKLRVKYRTTKKKRNELQGDQKKLHFLIAQLAAVVKRNQSTILEFNSRQSSGERTNNTTSLLTQDNDDGQPCDCSHLSKNLQSLIDDFYAELHKSKQMESMVKEQHTVITGLQTSLGTVEKKLESSKHVVEIQNEKLATLSKENDKIRDNLKAIEEEKSELQKALKGVFCNCPK